jgi:hypothetical protein
MAHLVDTDVLIEFQGVAIDFVFRWRLSTRRPLPAYILDRTESSRSKPQWIPNSANASS